MSNVIGRLELQMVADLARVKQDMEAVKGIVGGGMENVRRAASTAQAALATIGVGLSGAAFTAWIKGAINAQDEAAKLAQRIGSTVEQVAGLQLAFELGGSNSDGMAKAMSVLSQRMAQGDATLKALGVSTTDASGKLRSTRDVLGELADVFASAPDGARKTGLAMQLLSEEGVKLIPVLNSGSEGLRQMDEMAQKLGLTIDTATAKQAEQFNDTLALLGKTGQGMARQVSAELLPTLTALAGSFLDSGTSGNKLAGVAQFLAIVMKGLITVGLVGAEVFNSLGKSIGATAGALVAASQGNFREAVAVLREGGNDIKTGWASTLGTIKKAWGETADAAVVGMAKMTKELPNLSEQSRQAASAQNQLLQQLQKVAEAGAARADAQLAEAQTGRKLTEAERDYVRAMGEVAAGRVKLADLQRLGIQQRLQENMATAQAADRARAEAQWMQESARANEEAAAARRGTTAAMRGQLESERESLAQLGLSTRQLALRQAAQLRDAAAAKERAAAQEEAGRIDGKVSEELREQARLLRERAALAEQGVAAKEAQEAARQWERTTQSIEDGLTDALMRGFESGRSFMDSLVSTIKSTFKTLVLQPTIRAIVQPVAAGVGGLLGLPGLAQAGQGGGLLGGLGSLLGGGGNIMGSITGLGGIIGGGIGSSIGNGVAFGADALGSFLVNNTSGMLNSLGGSLMGNAGALGALAPYAAGAAALVALFRSLRHRRTPHMGSVVGIDAMGGANTLFGDDSGILNNFQAETDAALRGLGGASIGTLNQLSQAFGGTASFGGTLKFAADGDDASIGQFIVGRDARVVSQVGTGATSTTGGGQFAFYDKDRETAFTAFTADVARATREALDTIGLPQWARQQLAALGNTATIEQIAAVVQSITAFQNALRAMQQSVGLLGGVFGRVAGLGGDALAQLAEFAGGIQNFLQQTQSYVQEYFSRDEIAAIKASEIQTVLQGAGLSTDISTREEFRALVDSLDVGSEAGRQQLATLLSISGSFASLADYLAETGGSLQSVAGRAPEVAQLGGLFMDGSTAQVQATNQVTAAVQEVRVAIEQLQQTVQAPAAAPLYAGGGSSEVRNGFGQLVQP